MVAVGNTFAFRKRHADFHKLLGLRNRVKPRVFSPGMEMLRQAIRGADIRELIAFAHAFSVSFIQASCRIRHHIWVQRVGAQRRFKRLVMLRERAFRHFVDGKQAA
ncbi:hypothetical protein D3C75_653430 [compost metagenome]